LRTGTASILTKDRSDKSAKQIQADQTLISVKNYTQVMEFRIIEPLSLDLAHETKVVPGSVAIGRFHIGRFDMGRFDMGEPTACAFKRVKVRQVVESRRDSAQSHGSRAVGAERRLRRQFSEALDAHGQ
jgi:hypothetical protein